jgi:hypothetical protein
VEEPGLGVEPGARRVVRHPDVGPQLAQPVQRRGLRGAGVGGGEDPEPPPRGHVPPEPVPERPDPGAADERHDQVDPVSRRDLRGDLVPHGGLARRVGQQRRVQERDQRRVHGRGRAVGAEAVDGPEHAGGVVGALVAQLGDVGLLHHPLHQRPRQGDPYGGPLGFGEHVDGALDHGGDVPGDTVGGLGGAEVVGLLAAVLREGLQARGEGVGEEGLVEAGGEGGHRRYPEEGPAIWPLVLGGSAIGLPRYARESASVWV